MEFVTGLAFNILFQILKNVKGIRPHIPALAKLFVELEALAAKEPALTVAIRNKRGDS